MMLLHIGSAGFRSDGGYSARSRRIERTGDASGRTVTGLELLARHGRRRPSNAGQGECEKEGVHNVHTLGVGLGRINVGLGRFGDVFGGGQCLQGVKAGSSPTSGTVFPLVRGCFAL